MLSRVGSSIAGVILSCAAFGAKAEIPMALDRATLSFGGFSQGVEYCRLWYTVLGGRKRF